MKRYTLSIRFDGESERTFLGVFSEEFCRSYCKENASKPGIHIFAEEVTA